MSLLLGLFGLRANAQTIKNVTMSVTNDEDSGNVGYWALDNYTKNINVTGPTNFDSGGSYSATLTYTGTWQTFQGALSPGFGVPEGADASGPFSGGYTATFDATSSTLPDSGSLGSFDFGGTKSDILLGTYGNQTGDSGSIYDWVSSNFSGVTNWAVPTWGWTYTYGNQSWVNASSGNSGDIQVQPVPEPGTLSMLAGLGLSTFGFAFRRRWIKAS